MSNMPKNPNYSFNNDVLKLNLITTINNSSSPLNKLIENGSLQINSIDFFPEENELKIDLESNNKNNTNIVNEFKTLISDTLYSNLNPFSDKKHIKRP
ncbi:hypothetical protein OW763_12465 [Clostridium aestuarii]|uniref:Uncharacterized protein n=1 Tax=Clostridium aestuarii TaxID=338193 RepID=A0ABT4D3C8_9CLOT|nr:hypothetical protein [Clostridium aestuarii]MCY6485152.1 hypothetical protein [Clostridium aestuarii]